MILFNTNKVVLWGTMLSQQPTVLIAHLFLFIIILLCYDVHKIHLKCISIQFSVRQVNLIIPGKTSLYSTSPSSWSLITLPARDHPRPRWTRCSQTLLNNQTRICSPFLKEPKYEVKIKIPVWLVLIVSAFQQRLRYCVVNQILAKPVLVQDVWK